MCFCIYSESYDKILLEKTVVTGGTSPSHNSKLDPLASLAKQLGGSKRNALLRWCQNKTASYPVDFNIVFQLLHDAMFLICCLEI